MDGYEALNHDGLDYESAKDLLDNLRGLELEQDGDGDIVVTTAWMRTFDHEEPAYPHLKRYMREKGWWEERVDTSQLSDDDLMEKIVGWMFGEGNSSAVAVELAKGIRSHRSAGKEPTVEELAGYVLRAIGSQESVAAYLQYQLEVELADED